MKLAFLGYGKLGAALERMASFYPDLELVFGATRRPPDEVKRPSDATLPLISKDALDGRLSEIDCLLLTASSDADLPSLTPAYAEKVCVVDAFDRHAKISGHLARADEAAKRTRHSAILCSGWDPGLFSLFRALCEGFFPYAKTSTFWGRGVSEGHSSAVRHLSGVADAVSFTCPTPGARLLASQGVLTPPLERHKREVYVLPEPTADRDAVADAIRKMPDYFAGYETEVHFLDEREFSSLDKEPSHRGEVLSVGRSGRFHEHRSELSLSVSMDSNPAFTAGILLASARAAFAMQNAGRYGAFTLLDVPPAFYLSPSSDKEKTL